MTTTTATTTLTAKIITGDAYIAIETLKKESVDVCICSPSPPGAFRGPPMLVGTENNMKEYCGHLITIFNKVYDVVKRSGSLWVRMGDYHNVITGELNNTPAHFLYWMEMMQCWRYRGDVCWEREDEDYYRDEEPYHLPSDRFLRNWEHLLYFVKDTKSCYFNSDHGIHLNSVWREPWDRKVQQIPEAIINNALKVTCPMPEGVVLDVFSGEKCIMGRSAIKNSCHYIGIEIDPYKAERSRLTLANLGARIISE